MCLRSGACNFRYDETQDMELFANLKMNNLDKLYSSLAWQYDGEFQY